MNEEFLHYLWKHQLFRYPLSTSDGQDLLVIQAGSHNFDSGPDFLNSIVKIGNTTWAGNIEIHVKSSDWFKHKHQHDPNYDNIILHVVYENDVAVERINGEPIPTLAIAGKFEQQIFQQYRSFLESSRWIPCEHLLDGTGHFVKLSWLDRLMAERLEEKADAIEKELVNMGQDFSEVFYRKLLRSFGLKTNGEAFEHLAGSLPFRILSRHNNDLFQLESLLYGQAGMLNRKFKDHYPQKLKGEYAHLRSKYGLRPISIRNWKFLRMRPTNFPTIRISQFAQLVSRSSGLLESVLESDKLSYVKDFFRVGVSGYWTDHYLFDKPAGSSPKIMGEFTINLMIINTVVPFLFVFGRQRNNSKKQARAIDWLEEIKPETNKITRKFNDLGFRPASAMHTQALLQMKTRYCDYKRCLNCGIGQVLLNKSIPD